MSRPIRYIVCLSCLICLASAAASLAEEAAPAGNAGPRTKADSAEALPAQNFEDAGVAVGKSPHDRALTIHPAFSLLISGLNLSLEMPLGAGLWSFEAPLYIGYNERLYANPMFFAGSGFTLRRYLIERGSGAYFAPAFDFLNVHRFEKGPEAEFNLLVLAPNLRMGYRWTWKTFTMDASTGLFYYESILTQGLRSDDDLEIRGLLPMTQFSLGVPF